MMFVKDLKGESSHDNLLYEIVLKDNQPNNKYRRLGYTTAVDFITQTKRINHGSLPLSYEVEASIASYLFCNFNCDREKARDALSDFSKKHALYKASVCAISERLDLHYEVRDADEKRSDELWNSCVLLGSHMSVKKSFDSVVKGLELDNE